MSKPWLAQVTMAGWLKRLGWFLTGALGFLLVLYFFGLEEMDAVLRTDLRFAALVFVAVVGVTLNSALRLGIVTNVIMQRKVLTFRKYYAALVTSRVMGLFLPRSASEVGVPFATITVVGKATPEAAAAAITLDRIFDFTLLLLWLGPVLLVLLGVFPFNAGIFLFPLTVGVAVIVMVRIHLLVHWTARALSLAVANTSWPPALRGFFRARSRNLTQVAQVRGLSPAQAVSMAGLTVSRYLINTTLLFFIAQSLGLGVSFYTLLLVGVVMQLSQLFAITPGGLGVVEAGSATGLALAGVGSGEIAAFLVGQRVFQYVCFPVLGGITGLVVLWRPHRKPESAVEAGA